MLAKKYLFFLTWMVVQNIQVVNHNVPNAPEEKWLTIEKKNTYYLSGVVRVVREVFLKKLWLRKNIYFFLTWMVVPKHPGCQR